MSWTASYEPPQQIHWQGRSDIPPASCFFQQIEMLNLRTLTHTPPPGFALLGFCCDEGIKRNLGRAGASEGPEAIRHQLSKFVFNRANYHCYDAGDIVCLDNDLESVQADLGEAVALLLQHGLIPIVLGGGHEVAWGHYQGILKQWPQHSLGIINFDAHFDMRALLPENKGSSGTPFLQIARAAAQLTQRVDYNCIGIQPASNIPQLFETAEKYHTKFITADAFLNNGNEQCMRLINKVATANTLLYVSICLDVFAAPYAPGVSAPQPLGLTPWQLIPSIRQLASTGNVISYDIAELSPPFDLDGRTAKLAASLISEIIHHHKS